MNQERKTFNISSSTDSSPSDQGESLTKNKKWQLVFLMILHVSGALFGLSLPFLELIPKMECQIGPTWKTCTKDEVCTQNLDYRVDWDSKYSIVNLITQVGLLCTEDYKIGLIGSLVFLGFIVSSVTIMPLADIFGRKPVLLATSIISTTLAAFTVFASNLFQVYIFVFLIGCTILVRGTVSYIYIMETVPKNLEAKFIPVLTIIEKLVICSISIIFYLSQDWTYIFVIYCTVSYGSIVYICFIPESQKFLDHRKNKEDVGEIQSRNGDTEIQDTQEKQGFCDMIKQWSNLLNLFIMICCWSFTSSSYYLVSFYIKYFKGSVYINSLLFGVAGLVGTILFGILIRVISSKKLFILAFMLTFVGSIGFTLTKNNGSLVPIWILCMVTSLSIQFSLCYFVNCELFRPSFRTRIFSICNICARLFTMVSPMLVELMENPIILMSVWAIGMILLATRITIPKSE